MRYLFVLLLLTTPALAQQPQSPSMLALQINNVVGQMAQALEVAQQKIKDLEAENERLKAEKNAKQK